MELTAKTVMTLRDKTNLPMMKCKKALLDTQNGSFDSEEKWFDAAIEALRKQGVEAIDRFAGREVTNGTLGVGATPSRGAIVLLSCQTDFVANNEIFKKLADNLAAYAAICNLNTVDELLKLNFINEKINVKQQLADAILKLGENIVISKLEILEGDGISYYNHGGRIAALVSGNSGYQDKLKNITLHVTSANPVPIALNREQIPQTVIDKETEIISSLPDVQSKPEQFRTKIIEGKLNKYLKERVLLEQIMLLDALKNETVKQYADRNKLTISGFKRVEVNS